MRAIFQFDSISQQTLRSMDEVLFIIYLHFHQNFFQRDGFALNEAVTNLEFHEMWEQKQKLTSFQSMMHIYATIRGRGIG